MNRLFAASLSVAAGVLLSAAAVTPADPAPVVVHEWGTFTSIAGRDGQPVPWQPLGGTPDLPDFVRRSSHGQKADLTGTVRMETPVLYFYAPAELTLDVTVGFKQGVVTEYFPRAASGFTPDPGATGGRAHTTTWSKVRVQPGAPHEFPVESAPSHYYAARATDAAPVRVGPDKEGFLFYRGVGTFALPVTAKVSPTAVEVSNARPAEIPRVILFENRRGRIAWQVQSGLGGRTSVPLPAREADLGSLRRELERMLVADGLYEKEAAAMVETWNDSWFEEGTRLFYLLPQADVDAILPLDIRPAPAAVVRTFVVRLELATRERLTELADALRRGDEARLAGFGRFLRPFTELAAAVESQN